jgi:DNA-directed RNA polymerase specialized sigma24 family protein
MDHVLEAFLASPDQERSEQELGDLLERHAAPLARRIIARRLGGCSSDIEDVCAHVMLQLMLRLRRGRADADLGAIDAFSSYVATAAHHGCDHLVRGKHPQRWRLRGRLRYVLEQDSRFALWHAADGSLIGGLADWSARSASIDAPSGEQLGAVPSHRVHEFLKGLFELSGAPLELNTIVRAAADAWGVPLWPHDGGKALEAVADPAPRVDAALDQSGRLACIWQEIRELPVRQRHALLLNLKDDAITLFLTTGVASLREMAAALELPVEELAALWTDLPLPDNTVATRLECTRQQVINLRMAARKRLANRLSGRANIGAVRALWSGSCAIHTSDGRRHRTIPPAAAAGERPRLTGRPSDRMRSVPASPRGME